MPRLTTFQISQEQELARPGFRGASRLREQPAVFADTLPQDTRDGRGRGPQHAHNKGGRSEQVRPSLPHPTLRRRHQLQLRLHQVRRPQGCRRHLQEPPRVVVST